jgi:restriction system protein
MAFGNDIFKPFFTMIGWMLGGMWALAWLGGGYAGWQYRRKQSAFLQANIDIKWLWALSWQDFEHEVAQLFRQQGCHVEELGGRGIDGGIDLIVTRNGEKTFVQCKHWREGKVGVKPVRELYGVMVSGRAQNGILITSGRFSDAALEFAANKPLQLISGSECAQMFRNFQRSARQSQGRSNTVPNEPTVEDAEPVRQPSCPLCSGEMVLRRATRGKNAGHQFWGCSQFSKTGCKGIVNIK